MAIKIRLKVTMDIEIPMSYAPSATLTEVKTGVKADVQTALQNLFAGQTDFTPVPPPELIVMYLEDDLG